MKYLAVAITYFVAIALMLIGTSLAVDAAETSCGWVVWKREAMLSLKSSAGKDLVEYGNAGPWEVMNAAEDMEECQSLLEKYAKKRAKRFKKIVGREAKLTADGNVVAVGIQHENLLKKLREEKAQSMPWLYNFLCLPGSVDPRPRFPD
jgi:hypothetical protein